MSKKQGYCEKELQHKGHLFKLAQSKAGKNRTNQGKKRKKKPDFLLVQYTRVWKHFKRRKRTNQRATLVQCWSNVDSLCRRTNKQGNLKTSEEEGFSPLLSKQLYLQWLRWLRLNRPVSNYQNSFVLDSEAEKRNKTTVRNSIAIQGLIIHFFCFIALSLRAKCELW